MNFATHPRQIQRYRDSKLPTAGLMSFRCKTCGNTRYSIQGRKKLGCFDDEEWKDAVEIDQRLNSVRADRGKENASVTGL